MLKPPHNQSAFSALDPTLKRGATMRFERRVILLSLLAGLPPALLGFSREAASGWYTLFIPVGAVISAVLVGLLLRRSARAYFSED